MKKVTILGDDVTVEVSYLEGLCSEFKANLWVTHTVLSQNLSNDIARIIWMAPYDDDGMCKSLFYNAAPWEREKRNTHEMQ
jgi:hypothetical protein